MGTPTAKAGDDHGVPGMGWTAPCASINSFQLEYLLSFTVTMPLFTFTISPLVLEYLGVHLQVSVKSKPPLGVCDSKTVQDLPNARVICFLNRDRFNSQRPLQPTDRSFLLSPASRLCNGSLLLAASTSIDFLAIMLSVHSIQLVVGLQQ